ECCAVIGQDTLPPGDCDSLGCCVNTTHGWCFDGVDDGVCLLAGGFGSLPEGVLCDGGYAISCCMPDYTCADLTPVCCDALGVPADGSCTSLEACCWANGICEDNIPAGCCAAQGGTPLGPGSVCGPTQACCLPNGKCRNLNPDCCVLQGGYPKGPGTSCFKVLCGFEEK
ncbi:MAG: hypothetical protein JSU63_06625, partial [Phycisphaerales bacterium]